MENINIEDFKVKGKIKLDDFLTKLPFDTDKEQEELALNKIQQKLSKKQDAMYAHNRHAFLICLQGMDTSGKVDQLVWDFEDRRYARWAALHIGEDIKAAIS